MLKKTLFGILCAAGGVAMLWLRNTFIFTIAVAVVAFLMVYELNTTLKLKNKPIMVLSLIVGTLFPIYYEYGYLLERTGLNLKPAYLIALYIITLCIMMLFRFEETKFEQVAAVIVTSLGLPFTLTRLMWFRDIDEYFPDRGYTDLHGLFLVLFAMIAAWLTDVCAYFSGSLLGKHKLCPKISPKKSVEGAIGGVLGGTLCVVVLYAIFERFYFPNPVHNYLAVVILGIVLSAVSMCGDLSASVIKRNCGVKDFGNLVPEHGGVMDRFDSEVFVVTVFYAIFNIFEVAI